MNRVKRAIIMAAGKGERLWPVTKKVPKPLVEIQGVRMIDTAVLGLHENGITEIYIVIGYLKEKFAGMAEQYPGITLIENPYYETCNNISSLYMARHYIEDAIILDGDQMIYNKAVLHSDFTCSGYQAVWTEKPTDEWLLTEKEGIITGCSRNGGARGWQLYSISRWNAEDGKRLRRHLEIEFEVKKNRNIYWDDVAMFCYPEEYTLGIYPMNEGDVKEVDNLGELAFLDESYKRYLRGDRM